MNRRITGVNSLNILTWLMVMAMAVSACAPTFPAAATNTPAPAPTSPDARELPSPTTPPEATASTPGATQPPEPTTPAASGPSLWLPEYTPAGLRAALRLPAGWELASTPDTASLILEVVQSPDAPPDSIQWIYALAAPFHSLRDDQGLEELKYVWQAPGDAIVPIKSLLVDSSTRGVFEKLWGPAGPSVRTVPAELILEAAWSDRDVFAILPFEDLEPRWKVLSIDGQSPLSKDFQPENYGLSVYFSPQGDPELHERLAGSGPLAESNRDPQRLTTVVLTGVTALVRGTASLMEVLGMDYPAQDIGHWLREADILHISNEVPFARNCPQPFDWKELVFCSQTEYIQLLENVGADVIELTGDHFADWGPEAMLYTLDLYRERGWKYYGGGATLAEAQQPARFEHNGNRIAFLGCNGKDPGYATASETNPGAAHCDFEQLTAAIKDEKANGYLPIVTFQHIEYYQYVALPQLQEDFQRVADAGAVIVSGSQAHQPHAFEFRNGSFLHYGLGNLFFDQTNQGHPPRTAFIDRHIIYDGRHISTELLTIYLVDYARSRPMTFEERQELLRVVFEASGWEP